MGQIEVLNFLEKNKGRWYSTGEIREAIGDQCTPLRKLRIFGGLLDFEVRGKYVNYYYKHREK